MFRRVMLGNEAVALAAGHAGATGVFAVPGPPATEIHDTTRLLAERWAKIQNEKGVSGDSTEDHKHHIPDYLPWVTNEKSAVEMALGYSYAGKRALVSFNSSGLNVALDPITASALTGANGGLVVVVADDPGQLVSPYRQDGRYAAEMTHLPCIEPWDQQAAYDWVRLAFDLSEHWSLPILVRLVTRLCHSRASVIVRPGLDEIPTRRPVDDQSKWILQPKQARHNFEQLLERSDQHMTSMTDGPFFHFNEEGNTDFGIIACGAARNLVYEAFDRYNVQFPTLSVGAYPIPKTLVSRLMKMCKKILIVEDGLPFIEERLHAAALIDQVQLIGRLSGHLPKAGELTPTVVACALGDSIDTSSVPIDDQVYRPISKRSATQRDECSHVEVINVLNEVLEGEIEHHVFGDLGRYTMSDQPTYAIMETCVNTGAAISMAVGASLAGVQPSVAVMGDFAFIHTGSSALIDAVRHQSDIVVLLTDNRVDLPFEQAQDAIPGTLLVDVVRSAGVDPDHIHLLEEAECDRDKLSDLISAEIEYKGPSVIIVRHPSEEAPAGETEARLANAEYLDITGVKLEDAEDGSETPNIQRNVVVAGVGGQGVLPIAEAISFTAARAGLAVKQTETHGVSHEGESLLSHLRYSDEPVHSPLVSIESADVLLAIEPLEALRWLEFLGPDGHLIANVRPVLNFPAYPYLEQILQKIREVPSHTLLDAERLAAEAGSERVTNLVMLGAAGDLLGFDSNTWLETINMLWERTYPDLARIGMTAFQYGHDAAVFYRSLIESHVEVHDALVVAGNVKPDADSPKYARQWARKLAGQTEREILIHLDESTKLQPADPDAISFSNEPRP